MAPQPFIPFTDGAQVDILFVLDSKVVENRLWFLDRQPPITTLQLQALAQGVRNWHLAQVLPHLAQELTLAVVIARAWQTPISPLTGVAVSGANGGNTSGTHSANVAIRVALNGTSAHTVKDNANFIPGIPKDRVVGNVYDPLLGEAFQDAYSNLIDLAFSFGPAPAWRFVITSRRLNNAWRTEQEWDRTTDILTPSPYISPRRKRLP